MSNPTRHRRWVTAAVAALVAATGTLTSATMAGPAWAGEFRYWTYWIGDGSWSFGSVGPAFRIPADGTVEGWRFSITAVVGDQPPRTTPDFAAVCAGTAAVEGRKRVAVVVDSGTTADAPPGQSPPAAWATCVVADDRATGYDILRSVTNLRTDRGLICGIGGYPASGCGESVTTPAPTPTPRPTTTPRPTPTAKPAPTSRPTSTARPTPEPTRSTPSGQPPSSPTSPAPTATASAGDPATPDAPDPTSSPDSSPTSSPTSGPTASPTPGGTTTPDPTTGAPTPEPTIALLAGPPEPPGDSGGSAWPALLGITVIGGIGAAAALRLRRRP